LNAKIEVKVLAGTVAYVAGVGKGRGREIGRETACEGEGRRGTPGPSFSKSG